MTRINFVELIYQTAGEFNEKFEAKDLTTITKLPKESVVIMADGRRIWRVVENLYNNVAKICHGTYQSLCDHGDIGAEGNLLY